MKNPGLGDLSVLAYGLNLAVYDPPVLRKQENFSMSVFLTFTIYFVSEQGNRFGAKVISLGYLGYLTFKPLIFLSFLKLSV